MLGAYLSRLPIACAKKKDTLDQESSHRNKAKHTPHQYRARTHYSSMSASALQGERHESAFRLGIRLNIPSYHQVLGIASAFLSSNCEHKLSTSSGGPFPTLVPLERL